ncbi:E3 ubiquitin-protein ligase RNF8-like [Drosophila novamexicana]|uniref:E3 ubiquitin-protein ligase RNF8-like n=1 Tax=Drosophila novamexicana TaxID=47314 RepID=UPI0011E5C310|nr:E3 ubiquitin-protein ligase RNF8-like [Drosophila novamexicana]
MENNNKVEYWVKALQSLVGERNELLRNFADFKNGLIVIESFMRDFNEQETNLAIVLRSRDQEIKKLKEEIEKLKATLSTLPKINDCSELGPECQHFKSRQPIKPFEQAPKNQSCLQLISSFIKEQMTSLSAIQEMVDEKMQEEQSNKDKLLQKLAEYEQREELHVEQMSKLRLLLISKMQAKNKGFLELRHSMQLLKDEYENSRACSICWDTIKPSGSHRAVSLLCGHLFGERCIRFSLLSSLECPQCRAPAHERDVHNIYGFPA